ncbi:hypothetical protein A2348_02045 [Candidatus Uhrbacteria bacterium RIFOXYB12_FULL_58_10]|uniref:Glycosyl transferase family 1 domain-containing protein n=1 Tax=Candidatus Uhrbacteria bacterium RIFOXYB2_FULL_57_15 TaxID=1802422 RepID=A0A1F7W709_9BACT|nr:MAG: hypothetical protein A2348_02045 [Candidatus Uhrbacteria bacterium RIFOXYB12_FULL_58_10]OGL98559.1 MAG: hypothetical protein A2304_04295 [Candidatus Uhrbacteria bacterium RIFOXYB2_FULL_57_15]OGL99379.1 MAG: hypothetical protein A2501_00970 [Candidatus Uhrbacteria bacterium RIFOXYC12_FULL_57_11]
MQILVDVRHLSDRHKTGVGEYTSALLRALFDIASRHSFELFSSGLRRPPVETTHLAVPNRLLKLTTYAAGWPRIDRLAATRPDLVWLPNLNYTTISPDIPYALSLHDLSWIHFPEYFSRKMRLWHREIRPDRLVANAAAVIVPSTATKEDVVRHFQILEGRVHVVPHGVDPMFSPIFTAQDHGVRGKHRLPKRFALFVGTLEPRKNVVALIDAVEAYRRASGDDLRLVLVGGWGWKSGPIRNRLHAASSWTHHLGYVPRGDLPAIYRAATVFTWPSAYEGFGLPVLEAMASGLPVISSHTSSIPELTGDAAILVNPFRTDEITLALEQLLSAPMLQERLKRMGLERAVRFSWNRAAKQTLAIFEQEKIF